MTPGPQLPSASPVPSYRSMAEWLRRDRLLLGAAAACALLIAYQLAVTLVQPAWIGPVTDWLRTAAAWPELLVVAYVGVWLGRARRPEAPAWGMFSMGLLSYAIARTWWTVADTLIYPHGVPFPILPDLFFVLQYPFFFLAVISIPAGRSWGPRLIVLLDALLWMAAAAALSWYFLLAPLFLASGLSPLARTVSLGYPVADLFLLLALSLILLRPTRHDVDRRVVAILVASVACLILADSGAIWLILHPAHVYRTGNLPDLFWLASDLLVPLAALVQLRAARRDPRRDGHPAARGAEGASARQGLPRDDLVAGLRLFLPIVAALLASAVILLRALVTRGADVGRPDLLAPLAVSFGLLALAVVRQGVAYLENARLRRENAAARAREEAARAREEAARAREEALIELDRRKDEFLGVVGHELRTPLTILQGYVQLLARRFDARRPGEEGAAGRARAAALTRTALAHSEASVRRLVRLADDLADDARIRDGRLALRLAPCDLGAIVRAAVEDQRALHPGRTIRLATPGPPAAGPVPVEADAERIAQVVANYLTNALKYSAADRPVAVRLEVERSGEREEGGGDRARVWVLDEGGGLSLAEQAQVFERFPRIEGHTVQCGSGVSLGLGLYISRRIVEGHQGEVGVHSGPGQGATFFFTLPLERDGC